MQVGMLLVPQNYDDCLRLMGPGGASSLAGLDPTFMAEELRLADLAEPLGFDTLWTVEHHFGPYSMTCNPLQVMTYFAARTERIGLGTAVIVLPWHDPLRVAEEIVMLDHFAGGRPLYLGIARGAAASEFAGFGIDYVTSRERMMEAIEVVRLALSEETFSFSGRFFDIPETSVRPRPRTEDLSTRLFGAGTSMETMEAWAHEGLGPLFMNVASWEAVTQQSARFNEIRAAHGWEPSAPICAVQVYCGEDGSAAETGQRFFRQYLDTGVWHYDLFNTALKPLFDTLPPGPEGAAMRDEIVRGFYQNWELNHAAGTPEEVLQRLTDIQAQTGASQFVCFYRIGGMPADLAEHSLRLFAREVLPGLQAIPVTDSSGVPYRRVAAGRERSPALA